MKPIGALRLRSAAVGGGSPAETDIDAYTTGLWAAYSVRKILSAYAGDAMEVRESAGSTLADIGFAAGGLDIAALATHVGSADGSVRTWYNQEGTAGRDLQQTTSGAQPGCATYGVFPGVVAFDGVDDLMPTSGSSGTPTGFTVFFRGRLRSTGGSPVLLEHSSNYNSNDAAIAYYDSSLMSVGVHGTGGGGGYSRSDFTAYPNETVHAWRFDRSQAASVDMTRLFASGVPQVRGGNGDAGTLPSGSFGAHAWYLGARSGAVGPAPLDVHTLLIYESALSDADVAAICAILAALPQAKPATWNPADKDADVTLSSGNKVASIGASPSGSVRALISRNASDDRYFEIVPGGADIQSMPGIGNADASLGQFPGNDGNAIGFFGPDGKKYNAGSGTAYGSTYTTEAIGVQLKAGDLIFWINGVSQGVAYSGLSGDFYPMWGGGLGGTGTRSATLRLVSSEIAFLPPGSSAWAD